MSDIGIAIVVKKLSKETSYYIMFHDINPEVANNRLLTERNYNIIDFREYIQMRKQRVGAQKKRYTYV